MRVSFALGARIRLRCILVKGVNTDERHYEAVGRLSASLKGFDGVDVLPYHAYSGAKAVFLGLPDNGRPEWVPEQGDVEHAKERIDAARRG